MIIKLLPLTYSAIYMVIVISFGLILSHFQIFGKETTRKIIHIFVSLWWFTLYMVNNMYLALVLPIMFILLNSMVAFNPKIAKSLGFTTNISRNMGLIYFPISMSILIILYYQGVIIFHMGALAMLILGFGDASAAIFGIKFGDEKIHLVKNKSKSIIGSLMMFGSSVSIMAIYLNFINYPRSNYYSIILILITSIFATISEFLGNKGLDNILIIATVTLCFWLLW